MLIILCAECKVGDSTLRTANIIALIQLEGGKLHCRKQLVCIRESLHLDRPKWRRVLAIPLLPSATSGNRDCGWKITRLEVFTKVGGPLYFGEVGNTCSCMMPETTDRWLFLFCPLTCWMTFFHKDSCSIQCQRRQWTDTHSSTFTAPVSRFSLLHNPGLCVVHPHPPWPSRSILHDLINISYKHGANLHSPWPCFSAQSSIMPYF